MQSFHILYPLCICFNLTLIAYGFFPFHFAISRASLIRLENFENVTCNFNIEEWWTLLREFAQNYSLLVSFDWVIRQKAIQIFIQVLSWKSKSSKCDVIIGCSNVDGSYDIFNLIV